MKRDQPTPAPTYKLTIALDDREPEVLHVPTTELLPVTTSDDFKRAVADMITKRGTDSTSTAPWRLIATSKEEYLAVAEDPDYVRGLCTTAHWMNPNLLAFGNHGGIGGEGVCWWHSRFTRAALYLTYFVPDAPRPDEREVKRIVRRLMAADEVVAIPGFKTMSEFSEAHARAIQDRLELMQVLEGLFQFSWVNGLAGLTEVSPGRMKALMDKIYAEVRDNGVAYVKLQCPGIDSHAWLMTAMQPLPDGGYDCRFIDSNHPGVSPWTYKMGATAIFDDLGVPYLQREQELVHIKQTIRRFVAHETR